MSSLRAALTILMFTSATVCSAEETPLSITKGVLQSSELHNGSMLPNGQFEQYEQSIERNVLQIQSRNDQIVVKSLKLNRGNCAYNEGALPATLKFGEKLDILIDCEPIEATAITDQGDFDFKLILSGKNNRQ